MNPEIERIATLTRKWAEKLAIVESFPPDLCGLCGRASGKLFYELALAGFRPSIHSSGGHCFVTLDDHVIDITATQFNETRKIPVYIVETSSVLGKWQYNSRQSFNELKRFMVYQNNSGWRQPCVLGESDLCPLNQST